MKKIIPVLVAIVLIFTVLAVSFGWKFVEKLMYSNEEMDMNSYYSIEGENEVAIIIKNELIEDKALLMDGAYYFMLNTVLEHINSRFYYDENEGLLIYTTPTQIIQTTVGSSEYQVDEEANATDYVIAREEGGTIYLAADFIKLYTNYEYTAYTDPNRMVVETKWDAYQGAIVEKDSHIRYRGGRKSEIIKSVSDGDKLVVLEELDDWDKVACEGVIGYIEKSDISTPETILPTPVNTYEEPEYTSLTKDHKINLGWHQVTNVNANDSITSVVSATTGLNTISPTWFSISDNSGNISNIGSVDYVATAHRMGLEVWALVDNFSKEINSYEVLSHTTSRRNLIQNLIQAAGATGIDGINVDFEQLSVESGVHFAQFVRELSTQCRKQGLVLSVDNYVSLGNTDFYARDVQGEVADYVIIMGYDEHWGGCQEAGSVASIGYVETGIENTLKEVPAEKIINGIPFYTRVWKTMNGQVSSEVVGMSAAESFLAKNGVTATWDENTCQNYAEFNSDGAFYQVWLEDEQSIQVKLNIMLKHNLGGVAEWKLGFEKASVWPIIESYVSG